MVQVQAMGLVFLGMCKAVVVVLLHLWVNLRVVLLGMGLKDMGMVIMVEVTVGMEMSVGVLGMPLTAMLNNKGQLVATARMVVMDLQDIKMQH